MLDPRSPSIESTVAKISDHWGEVNKDKLIYPKAVTDAARESGLPPRCIFMPNKDIL